MPTQPIGGERFRQRQSAAPPPGRTGGPTPAAPRKSNIRLILLLAALVGIIIGGAIGILAFTKKGATTTSSATPTSAPVNIVGVVSFTASGGLQGKLSINLPKGAAAASSIQKGASDKVLEVVVNDATMDFELGLSPYPGPGTYTLLPFQTNPAPGSYNGTVRISNHQSTWSLHSPAQCKVTISSDTSLNKQAQGKPLDEVKGSFTCPSLASDAGSAKALKITQGQFDVYALVLGS